MEFIEDITSIFPNDKDISACKLVFSQVRKINPKLIILTYNDYMKEYRDEIENGDIEFFINKDYKRDLPQYDARSSQVILDKIDSLREPIKYMKKDEQEKCMNYLKNLLKLCDLYN